MKASIFKTIIEKYFPKTAKKYYEKINGSKDEPKYLHDQMLTEEYSPDMTYTSISGNYTRVTADVVSFDSPVPLKSRATIKQATGDIPKLGIGFSLNEKQMNTLRILKNAKGRLVEFLKKIFKDTESCIFGIKEKIEQAHLIGFSSGVTIIQDEQNVGHGIRINYNIPEANQFGVVKNWNDIDSKPIDDIKRVKKYAKTVGEYPNTMWIDSYGLDRLLKNKQVREFYAAGLNYTGTNFPALDEEQVTSLFRRSLKLNLRVIERSFIHEKDGKRIISEGWVENMVVFTTGTNVGSLVYSTLAEEEFPTEGVVYTKPNPYILISKSGSTNPVSELTAGQALAIPVLQNVESLFYINSAELDESEQVEEDSLFKYDGTDYQRSIVVQSLNEVEENLNVTEALTDAQIQDIINQLSDESQIAFELKLEELTP
ncbi:MAG: major capsid protein [Crocinitomicaceae bacterium]|nr:major capsid protein [Crocinitomicaceae bacterium]